MAKSVYDIWSDDVDDLGVSDASRRYYTAESRPGGAWYFDDGLTKKGRWKPIELVAIEPDLPKPDIWKMGSILFLERRAFDVLAPLIEEVGEFFEQPFENRVLYLFHVTVVLDVLEKVHEFSEEGATYHLQNAKTSLFRLPWGALRAVSGNTPPSLDFRELVVSQRLTGILFREIWNDTVGSIQKH